MNVSLVINPIAGNRAHKYISKIETLIRKKACLTTLVTQKKGDAYAFAGSVENADRIIVVSGDGTINEIINGICSSNEPGKSDIPIGLIPLGITNVLAKELGIPEDIEKAVDIAITGNAKKIALGKINGTYFASMAGFGFDGETVLGVKNDIIRKISGKAAHIVQGFKVLLRYNPPLMIVKADGKEISGYTAVISNIRCYGGYYYLTPRASITEPLLDVCLFKGKTRKDLVRFIFGVINQKHLGYEDVFYTKASEIEIVSEGEVHIQIDGDYLGTLPAKVSVVRDAVCIVW